MKKTILCLLVVLAIMGGFNSCGEKKIEQSPEMVEFLSMIKGQAFDVVAALSKFGATDDIKTNDMSFYNLKAPKVIDKVGDCYTVKFKTGMTVIVYDICWEAGKIVQIIEKETE